MQYYPSNGYANQQYLPTMAMNGFVQGQPMIMQQPSYLPTMAMNGQIQGQPMSNPQLQQMLSRPDIMASVQRGLSHTEATVPTMYNNGQMVTPEQQMQGMNPQQQMQYQQMQQQLQFNYMAQKQQSMMQGGMFGQPMNPVQGMTPIGFGGVQVGGYFTNNYYMNGYNPTLIQQQAELMQAQYREEQRNQCDIMQRVMKGACAYSGDTVTNDQLNEFTNNLFGYSNGIYNNEEDVSDLTYEQQEEYYKIKQREQVKQYHAPALSYMIQNPAINYNQSAALYAQAYNKIFNEYQSQFPEGMGFIEYMSEFAGKDWESAKINEQKRNNANLGGMYNKAAFGDLMNMHKNRLFGNSLNPNSCVDVKEVTLPTSVSSLERQKRRSEFLNACMLASGGVG